MPGCNGSNLVQGLHPNGGLVQQECVCMRVNYTYPAIYDPDRQLLVLLFNPEKPSSKPYGVLPS